MTNEEIRDFAGELPAFHLGDSTPVIRANSLPVLLDLARADEREKIKNQMLDGVMTDSEFEEYTGSKRDQPQGVDIWVSWDDNNSSVAPELWIMRPRPNMNGTFTGKVHHDAISSELNLLPGQCRKFRIVEVE